MTFLDDLPIYAPISVAAVLLLLGGWIVRKGWHRRKGTQPHCRKCDYLLLAIQSDRCPECGSSIKTPGVILGERNRSWRTIIAGCIVLIIALAPIYALTPSAKRAAAEFNWYHYRPTAWVMDDLRNGAGKPPPANVQSAIGTRNTLYNSFTPKLDLAQIACEELLRRDGGGALGKSFRNQLFDLGLAAAGAKYPDASPQYDLIEYASDRVLAGDVTEEQKGRFFEPSLQEELYCPSTVADGHDISIRLKRPRWHPRYTSWQVSITYQSIDVDGQAAEPLDPILQDENYADGPIGKIACPLPGHHQINVTIKVSVRHVLFVGQTTMLKLSAPLDVIANSPPRVIRLTRDSSLTDKLASALHPEGFRVRKNSPLEPDGILGTIWIFHPSPVNLAFDVSARFGGHEYPIGRFIAPAKKGGVGVTCHFIPSETTPTLPDVIDIVLRSNPRVAMSVPDMNDIWNGEVVLHDVPIAPSN